MDRKINVTDFRDYLKIEQGGVPRPQKRVTFYIDNFGPFVEYFDTADYSKPAFDARVALLIANLPG